ncbi:MAG: hypothetical protein HY763_05055 [Planctomycetes bacterium]|nr:hypothetical protein [Planctomycetota bacterium]
MPRSGENPDEDRLAALLREWGSAVREGREAPLFPSPRDSSSLHRRLDAVDAELARERLREPAATLRPRLGRRFALAAMLLLAASAWLAVREFRGAPGTPVDIGAVLAIADLEVRPTGGLYRGAPVAFRSGDVLSLSFNSNGRGAAVVALIDHDLKLSRVSGVVPIQPGTNQLAERFQLNEQVGTETLAIIAVTQPLTAAEFDEAIGHAAAAAVHGAHADRRDAALRALRRDPRFAVQSVTFDHLPR